MTTHPRLRNVIAPLVATAMLAIVCWGGAAVAEEAPPTFVTVWGASGAGDGFFATPYGVAVDASTGAVYVADANNHRIQEFDADGTYLTQWGGLGSGNGSFSAPQGVAVGADGTVYVADTSNHRIQAFDADGTYLRQWGSIGNGTTELNSPIGLATDATDHLYVADTGNDRIEVFTASTGAYVRTLGGAGTGNGEFTGPQGVAVAGGNVYVTDTAAHRVQVLSTEGTYGTQWGQAGTGPGEFGAPVGVGVGDDGHVYVADFNNNRVQVFATDGTYVTEWGTVGADASQFSNPSGLAVAAGARVYVADTNNDRIQVFGPPAPRPDARIKKGSGTFVGNDVYNTTGVGQTRTGRAARGATVTYTIKAQNDAAVADTLRLKGTRGTSRFGVTYFAGATDITAAITAGTYTTPALAPDATFTIRAVVKVKSSATTGSSLTATLTAKSATDPTVRDTVKFVTRRA